MKKLIYVVVITVVAALAILFTYKNHQTIDINFYWGLNAQVELSVLLFITFGLGVLCAYLASLVSSIKLRRRLAKANKQLQILQNPIT
ncbi:MAG: LapA family protein [Pseudomonadota bacterium]